MCYAKHIGMDETRCKLEGHNSMSTAQDCTIRICLSHLESWCVCVTRVCVRAWVYVGTYVCMYVVCMYVRMYVGVCMYVHSV